MTFVLTDIVGSTQLWQSAPDAVEEALAAHDRVIAEAVESQGGVMLKNRGEGDSTFSVFSRASDGVRAAYGAQVALSGYAWPEGVQLRVRVAVHTGEAVEKDGDYVGTTVNRAARLRAVAEGGEVIVSSATAQLVVDHLPLDTSLDALGPIRLRDLEREDACALVGPGLVEPGRVSGGVIAVDVLAEAGVTRRERDVLGAIGERLTNSEIAALLSVSERTVESHVSALLRKLDAANRVELASIANNPLSTVRAQLPPMLMMSAQRSECVGRQAQLEALLRCWDRAASGQTVLALVTGEAGIGKTRVAAELAVKVHRRGGQVLLGASTDGAQMAYQPFVDALSDLVAATPESQLRSDLSRHVHTLPRLFPGQVSRLGSAMHRDLDPLSEREELQATLAVLVTQLARRHPTLIVLEDMHWASAVTREAVLQVARIGGTTPLLLVVTTRDTPPELDRALTTWLAAAGRLPSSEVISVPGLDIGATAELLDGLGGHVDPAAALRHTGGNPLLLREIAAGGSSPTLQDLLATRCARLTDADLDVLDTAAALGESFRADLVAAATELSVSQVINALEHAAGAGLVDAVARQPGRWAFLHALFRDACYEALSAGRRLLIHARVASALAPHASDPTVLPELARHACIAAPLGGADAAVGFARAAGEASLRVGDYPEARRHFQAALDVIDLATNADESVRLALLIRLGEVTVQADWNRGQV
ncbi:MAG TPA: AAA family ATPase, partial [Acidimicrobiales bacterium]|nr:AAA family ATPase [Acidimicrobiales bacterium]